MPVSAQQGNCCPNNFVGFCLSDGTPIAVVIDGGTQTGWINILTGVFTPGAPPAGTVICSDQRALDCVVDSVAVCAGDAPLVVVASDLDIRPLACDTDAVTVCQPTMTATVTSVANSLTSVTLLAANPNRKRAMFHNDSGQTALIKFGAVASATSFSVRLLAQTFYQLDFSYVGVIDAIWLNPTGFMRITEFI
jgi:ethanolamine transporter EutH